MNRPPDCLAPGRTAFFLDFDGTLAGIVADPAEARVATPTLDAVGRLARASDGALAVISGRSIGELDRMLHPLRLPLAGVHGLERRGACGETVRIGIDPTLQHSLVVAVTGFAAGRPGLVAEPKPGSVALHYRQRPELESACIAFAHSLALNEPRIRLLPGKMVIEMTLGRRTKGDAIADFMAEPPFQGRRPFFAGDDITDEAGFAVVNRMGGVTLKIGGGETLAHYRLPDTEAFASYLAGLSDAAANSTPDGGT